MGEGSNGDGSRVVNTDALPHSFGGVTYCHCHTAPGPKAALRVSFVVTEKASAVDVTTVFATDAPTDRLRLPLPADPIENGKPTERVSLRVVVHEKLVPWAEVRAVPK